MDYPDVAESDNAYFGRWMCCKELLWATDAGVPVIPIIRAEDKKKIGEFTAQAPSDLKVHESCSALKEALGKIDFIHVDRSTNEDWNFGVGKVIKRYQSNEMKCLQLHSPTRPITPRPSRSQDGGGRGGQVAAANAAPPAESKEDTHHLLH